uniref:DNA repair protein REV1 n=1 Tax=Panagrolaimus sp. JU765 TaxID=591449 RepID=A0AC34Q083_9BILA
MEEAIKAIGNNQIVSNPRKRAAELGLNFDGTGQFQSFGDYMRAKVSKLMVQCNNPENRKSNIFSGLSFFVNGKTSPPSHEIQRIVTENGGEYHHYYIHGKTTYQLAEVLANTKIERLRKDEIYLKPNFITDCLRENRLLPINNYLLLKSKDARSTAAGQAVQRFFNRSRLHLISTMAAEFKKFVADLKMNEKTHEFSSRNKLEHLSGPVESPTRIICHIDMDCFFVSVALIKRPDLTGKPVAITHSTASSSSFGEISSCSYEARKKGVYARQLVRDALKTCPDLVCLPYQFEEYVTTAKKLYSIIAKYTLRIKAVSCDELYFDIGSICSEMSIPDPLAVISIIRKEILDETKCVASAGLGPNWLLARLATKKAKPNGQFYVKQENAIEFIKDLPINDLPTIGWSSCENLQEQFGNVQKCGQLMGFSMEKLRSVLGMTNGEKVFKALRGKCDEIDFDEVLDRKSISVNVNFGVRLKNEKDLEDLLSSVSTEMSDRLKQAGKCGVHLSLKYLIRLPDAPIEPEKYGAHGPVFPLRKAGNLSRPTANKELIYDLAQKLTTELKPVITDIRGISLHLNKLVQFDGRIDDADPKLGKTLWDFIQVKTKPGENPGKITQIVWKAPPKDLIKKSREQRTEYDSEEDEMRMKISDVVSVYQSRPVEHRELGTLPVKPVRNHKENFLFAKIIDNKRLNVSGKVINWQREPTEILYLSVLHHFKNCIRGFQIGDLKRMFGVFERHLTCRKAHPDWAPFVMKAKMFLNRYCFLHHQRKIFDIDFSNNQEENEKQKLLAEEYFECENRPRASSPDLFDNLNDSGIHDCITLSQTSNDSNRHIRSSSVFTRINVSFHVFSHHRYLMIPYVFLSFLYVLFCVHLFYGRLSYPCVFSRPCPCVFLLDDVLLLLYDVWLLLCDVCLRVCLPFLFSHQNESKF